MLLSVVTESLGPLFVEPLWADLTHVTQKAKNELFYLRWVRPLKRLRYECGGYITLVVAGDKNNILHMWGLDIPNLHGKRNHEVCTERRTYSNL